MNPIIDVAIHTPATIFVSFGKVEFGIQNTEESRTNAIAAVTT